MDQKPLPFRYVIFEYDGLHYLTSPDHRGLLVATVSRRDSLEAAPLALRNYLFRQTGVLGAVPILEMLAL